MRRLDWRPACAARSSAHELRGRSTSRSCRPRPAGSSASRRCAAGPDRSGSVVEPAEFVPIAEETGLIVPLGRWVLERGLRAARRVARAPARRRADRRRQRLPPPARRPGLRPTSSPTRSPHARLDPRGAAARGRGERADAATRTPRGACSSTAVRRALGVRYAHRRLRHRRVVAAPAAPLPRRRGEDRPRAGDRRWARTRARSRSSRRSSALAHNLGLEVIAEGVETPGQLDHLKLLGCEFAQGFHVAAPARRGRRHRAAGARDGGRVLLALGALSAARSSRRSAIRSSSRPWSYSVVRSGRVGGGLVASRRPWRRLGVRRASASRRRASASVSSPSSPVMPAKRSRSWSSISSWSASPRSCILRLGLVQLGLGALGAWPSAAAICGFCSACSASVARAAASRCSSATRSRRGSSSRSRLALLGLGAHARQHHEQRRSAIRATTTMAMMSPVDMVLPSLGCSRSLPSRARAQTTGRQ